MIYLNTQGGLCNRMRAIASAYYFAEKYETEVKVLWPRNKELNCSFYQLFQKVPKLTVLSAFPKIDVRKFYWKTKSSYSFIGATTENISEIDVALRSGKDIYISTPHSFCSLQDMNIFTPINRIKEKIDIVLPLNKNVRVIGIHIRRTDNIKSIEQSPTFLFEDFIRNKLSSAPNSFFYLATDSFEEEKHLVGLFGDRIITYSNKQLSRSSSKGIKDALIDLGCLSRCSMIVGSYWSSFSETAAEWNGNKELLILKNRIL